MRYLGSVSTDIGISRKTNQDSACIKVARTRKYGQVALGIVCDGMGGLAKGELASATVIRAFAEWFEKELPKRLETYTWDGLANEWVQMIKELNQKILDYGKKIEVNLGTTLSMILFIENRYMLVQVGDSRIYELGSQIRQLTEDQTFVEREVKRGNITPEEAKYHPKRHMLLQCVGASRVVEPVISYGEIKPNTVFLLCSDGFRNILESEEIYERLNPYAVQNMKQMLDNEKYLIELVKSRNERDNITVALMKCTE